MFSEGPSQTFQALMLASPFVAAVMAGGAAVAAQMYVRNRDIRDHRRALLSLVAEIVHEVRRASDVLARREKIAAMTGYSKLKIMEEQLGLFPVYSLASAEATLILFQLRTQLRFLVTLLDEAHDAESGWTPFQLSVGLVEGLLKRLGDLFGMPGPAIRH